MFPKLILSSILLTTAYSVEWTYDEDWTIRYPQCGGQSQSPINIEESQTIFDSNLKNFDFFNYDKDLTWSVKNDGHSIVATLSSGSLPYVEGSDFTNKFEFVNFHFHWGRNINEGSEHFFNSKQYPLEVHLVHRSASGTLAVLGFFFEISQSDNSNLNEIIEVANMNESDDPKTIQYKLDSLIPDASLLNTTGYFRYNGSLTTPACNEGVIWTVFKSKIPISQTQVQKFYETGFNKTFRAVQSLNGRIVSRSVLNSSSVFKKSGIFLESFIILLLLSWC